MTSRMRQTSARLSLALVGLIATMIVALAPKAEACNFLDVVYLWVFDITLEADPGPYQLGDTVTVQVTVRRPAEEDPLGFGIPLPVEQGVPAGGIQVAVSLQFPRGLVYGWGYTDDDGKLTLNIPINIREDRFEPGPAKAAAYAWASYPLGCTRIDEIGFVEIENFIVAE